MSSRFIHLVACYRISFLLKTQYYSLVCIDHILFIHLSVGYLVCFHLLAIVNSAAINMGVQIPFWDPAFNSFAYIPRSGIARSYVNSIFNFLRNCHTTFPQQLHCFVFYISMQGFQFLHVLANACFLFFVVVVVSCHPNRYEAISHCGFDLHFPDD